MEVTPDARSCLIFENKDGARVRGGRVVERAHELLLNLLVLTVGHEVVTLIFEVLIDGEGTHEVD
jgi:hypothetical protein